MKKIIKSKSDDIPEDDNDVNSLNSIVLKQNSNPNFDRIKHNIYRYININIPKDIE